MRIISRSRSHSTQPAPATAAHHRVARAAARTVEGLESRILFHYFVANDIEDVNVSPGTPTSTVNLAGVIDSEEISGTVVRFTTTNGNIDLMLYDAVKPVTVTNFLKYVTDGDYNQTLVHRTTTVADDALAVIQGGGYAQPGRGDGVVAFDRIDTDPPIPNEFTTNGTRSNVRGTIAMAKTSDPNSATSEWFVNVSDNSAALDNPANAGGFTVFGEVIGGTLATVDAIQQLPHFAFNSPFGQMPLRNYTETDFPTTPTENSTVNVTTAAVLPEVTYTAASSNEGLVTVGVVNNQLTLTYAAGQIGAADITVTGTGLDGTQVTDTFTVNVGAVGITVGDGAAKAVTFTDADGTVGTISVKGGTATISLDGSNLTQTTGKGGITVGGQVATVSSITLNGTTGASTLTVKARGGDGVLEVGSITGTGGLKSLAGRQLSINGDVNLGTVGKIDLADITEGSITIGGSAPVSLSILGGADDTDITSTAVIKSVKLGRFGGADGVAQTLTAPSITKLTSGDFAGNLTVSGAVGNAKVAGTATAGTWTVGALGATTVTGDLGSDLIVGTLKSLKAGSVTNADVFATGAVGKIATGNVAGSRFFSAIPSGVWPDGADDITAGGSIAGLTVKGSFTGSNVAADVLGKLNLGTLTTANGGVPFGVAGNTIVGVTAGAAKASRLTEPSQSIDVDDFEIRVF